MGSSTHRVHQTTVFLWDDLSCLVPLFDNLLSDALTNIIRHGFLLNDSHINNVNIIDSRNALEIMAFKAKYNCSISTKLLSTSFLSETNHSNILSITRKCDVIRDRFEQNKSFQEFFEFIRPFEIDPEVLFNHVQSIETTNQGQIFAFYRDCLSMIFRSECVNAVISYQPMNGSIAGSLATLMLGRMSEYIKSDNVFCINRSNTELQNVMMRLRNKFSKKNLILITERLETKKFAESIGYDVFLLKTPEELLNYLRDNYTQKPFEDIREDYLIDKKRCPVCEGYHPVENFPRHFRTHGTGCSSDG